MPTSSGNISSAISGFGNTQRQPKYNSVEDAKESHGFNPLKGLTDYFSGRDELQDGKGDYALPGFDSRRGQLLGMADRAGRNGPSDFRRGQRQLGQMLDQRARGHGLASTEMLRQSTDRNIAQQQALAASARPGQAGLAARMAAQNVGRLNQGLAGQQSLAGIQEMNAAQGQLGNLLGQARQQDQGLANLNSQRQLELLRQELLNAQLQQQGGIQYNNTLAGVPTGGQVAGGLAVGALGAAGTI